MRAICSLTAESRKHLNSFTLKLVGTTSSENALGRGEKLVLRATRGPQRACCVLDSDAERSQRQQRFDRDLLSGDAFELHVDDIEPIDLPDRVFVEIAIGDHVDFVESRLVFEVGVGLDPPAWPRNLKPPMPRLPEISSRHCGTSAFSSCQRSQAGTNQIAVEAAAQTAIGRQHQQRCPRRSFRAASSSGMANLQAGLGQVGDQLRDAIGIGGRRRCSVHRLLEARGGDQLHRPRNLADVADRLAAFVECSGIGHGWSASGLEAAVGLVWRAGFVSVAVMALGQGSFRFCST